MMGRVKNLRPSSPASAQWIVLEITESHIHGYNATPNGEITRRIAKPRKPGNLAKVIAGLKPARGAPLGVLVHPPVAVAQTIPMKVQQISPEAIKLNVAPVLNMDATAIEVGYVRGSKGLLTLVYPRELLTELAKAAARYRLTPRNLTYAPLAGVVAGFQEVESLKQGNAIWFLQRDEHLHILITEEAEPRSYRLASVDPHESSQVVLEAIDDVPRPPGKPLYGVLLGDRHELTELGDVLKKDHGFTVIEAIDPIAAETQLIAGAMGDMSVLEGLPNRADALTMLAPPSLSRPTKAVLAGALAALIGMVMYGESGVAQVKQRLNVVNAEIRQIDQALGALSGIQQQIQQTKANLARYEDIKKAISLQTHTLLPEIARALQSGQAGVQSLNLQAQTSEIRLSMLAPDAESLETALQPLKKMGQVELGNVSFGGKKTLTVDVQVTRR